jgi:AraC-like DNA-binding protein
VFFQEGSKSIAEDVEYICRLMFHTLNVPICFLDNNYEVFYSFSTGHMNNPLQSDNRTLLSQLFYDSCSYSLPMVRSTRFYENYLAVTLKMEDTFIGTFIAGPSTYSSVTAEAMEALISQNNLSLSYRRELINFYNSIPVIDYTRLINAGLLLFYCLYNKKLDSVTVMEKNSTIKNVALKVKNESENSISKNRQGVFFHHTQAHEKNIFQSIKEGNSEKLAYYLEMPIDGKFGVLSKNNPLRSHKNLSISAVTLATRAAMDGGLDSELAYTISDSYIQSIEEVNDEKDLSALTLRMFYDFADRVNRVKQLKYPKVIIECQSYIFKHLYEDISLSAIAESIGLNQNYLSELFKKEVGLSISEYIQRERIEESKRLLTSSDYSILEIATWLSFHDQSHFTRVFKKVTGTTPKRYRGGIH